jgi:hypothetical protein
MLGFTSVFPSTFCWSAREAGHALDEMHERRLAS